MKHDDTKGIKRLNIDGIRYRQKKKKAVRGQRIVFGNTQFIYIYISVTGTENKWSGGLPLLTRSQFRQRRRPNFAGLSPLHTRRTK